MSPSPQEHVSGRIECEALDGEKIVVSGMSGLYAQAHNVKELSDILYNKINPVTPKDSRWNYNHPEVAPYSGKIPDTNRFDAHFFMVHNLLGNNMDTMARKALEHTYQAIYDAGVNPAQLNGKKVAVYIGTSFSEAERTSMYETTKTGFGISGSSKSMFANRISFWLNLKGPSMAIDETCCSSSTALEQAYLSIQRGESEAAIVGGCSTTLLPHTSIHYKRMIDMSKDDKTKSFDQNAEGCVNSDAINIMFLQKAKYALRVYAEIVHVKNEFRGLEKGDTGPLFGFRRNPANVAEFMQQFYKDARVSPYAVEYVEALGSATPEADKAELQAIENVFIKNRKDTLLVGSVTSNVGFTQAASGLTAITKVLLGYHNGMIAANLNCDSPRQDVVALREGRMRIVTEHQPCHRSYVAVNGMSVTGVNSHVLLHGRYKSKDISKYMSSIPHLVAVSGRQESGVTKIIEDLKSSPIDPEEIALLHNIHSTNITGHLGRGFVILDSNENQETVCLAEKTKYFDHARRPLWFVYSGMGSQWAGMGAKLMRIPIFAAAIERCQRVLAPKGLDLVHIITSPDKDIFENILNSFVGIAAVQIGLTDILHEMGLKADGIIGHSVGELGCAYADGCLTAEEMILSAYSRGRVSLETKLIRGSMAAVGLGYEEVSKLCPPEIFVACHNGPASSTISGPAEPMRGFVAELVAKGIFAREVPCSNIAYHSQYIANAGPGLLKYLTELIKDPKPRSERWVSTSVPQDKWHEPSAKYCSAEYLTNNLLGPVLFEETSRQIPNNAVCVEVAPHGLLQAILKRSLPVDCRHVPLTKRGHPDNTLHLLQAVGNLYTEGYNPEIQVLYPKVQFPVATGTPMLSHLVEWIHIEKWNTPGFKAASKIITPSCKFVISVHDEEHSYLRGHVIQGKTVYPSAALLVAVWDTFAMFSGGGARHQGSIQFHDVHLHAQPTLHDQWPLRLSVALQRGNGRFEILNGVHEIATGYIVSKLGEKKRDPAEIYNPAGNALLSQDVYQLLDERDYSYSNEFQIIACASLSLDEAALMWRDNWVTFIDGLLQLNMLRQPHDGVTLPTHIRRLDIDVNKHVDTDTFDLLGKERVMKVNVFDVDDCTRCGGVSVHNVTFKNLPVREQNEFKFKSTVFRTLQLPMEQSTKKTEQSKLSLQMTQPGDLSTLFWAESSDSNVSDLAVTVHYAGLNITDASKATGTAVTNNGFGMDFSGTLPSGSHVMGLVPSGAAASLVHAQPELLWPVPAHWRLEDAATVPLAYTHAFYCFRIKAQLCEGMNVLIHGGTGALGQAAISIALALNCQVFTTVSNMRKKQFLRQLYPQLKDEFIGNSRDASFANMVLSKTNGKGCHFVLSCVKTDLKNETILCGGHMSTVLDTVQIKYRENYHLGMYCLCTRRVKTYATIDFSSIFWQQNYKERRILQSLLCEGISRGYVRPLSCVSYAPHDAARALQLLAASGHRGKVLLRMQHAKLQAQHRLYCSPETSFLIFCDEQPLGMQQIDRLVSRGAKHVSIVCTSITPYHWFKISAWQKQGVIVKLLNGRLNEKNAVVDIIEDALRLGPLEGIYYVVLSNIENHQINGLTDIVDRLDLASRSLCSSLKYFAVVSSNSNIAQNTCQSRAKANLPATMLDLSTLTKIQSSYHRNIINALESALCGSHSVLLSATAHSQTSGLLQQLDTLTGIYLSRKDDNTNLQELDLTNDKIQEIITLLRDTYNINIEEEEEISQLTVAKIKELNKIKPHDFKNLRGLATFFSYVDPDEQLASTDVVLLSTLAKDISSDEDYDVSKKYLCILPGMEGNYERFRVLCERLKLPALVLQPGVDHPTETVRETAHRYVEILQKKIKIKDDFYLLGYETGIFVALEVAEILESLGFTGTVFCVGYAPEELPAAIDDQLSDYKTKVELQNAIIRHMSTLMAGKDLTELERAVQDEVTWEEKLVACVGVLRGHVSHSAQYIRGLIEAALASIERSCRYTAPKRALCSKLILLRAASNVPTVPNVLQRHSQQPITIYQLSEPLAHLTNGMRVPAFINKHLSMDILQEFNKENLCDSYLMYSDAVAIPELDD